MVLSGNSHNKLKLCQNTERIRSEYGGLWRIMADTILSGYSHNKLKLRNKSGLLISRGEVLINKSG